MRGANFAGIEEGEVLECGGSGCDRAQGLRRWNSRGVLKVEEGLTGRCRDEET